MAGLEAVTTGFRLLEPRVRRLVLVGMMLGMFPFGAAHASGDADAELRFADLVAAERSHAGQTDLVAADDLAEVAHRHATRMADEGRLHHNPRLGDEVHGWQVVGENVGRGSEPDSVHAAFMESDSHRANILDGRFTEIGVGVVARGGDLWVVEVFRLPARERPPAPAAVPTRTVAAAAVEAPEVPEAPEALAAAPTTTPAPPTTTVATAPPTPLRPPVADLPAGPPPPAEVELHAVGAVSVSIPDIPPATKLAATLLVVVVAAQVATLRRLRLV